MFYPAAEHLITTRITRVEGEPFKTEGKVLVKAGWLEIYGREAQAQNEGEETTANLVPVRPDERVRTEAIEQKASQTKAPPRYNEATLLGAMEGAGKLVEDDELRSAMADRGLGTPATRASIIEGLVDEEYLHRNGNELQPTGKAFMLVALLRGLGIEELSKPELTGEWEHKLKEMEAGRYTRPRFMQDIAEMTRRIVERTKAFQGDEVPGDFGDLAHGCPKCGAKVKENYRRFQCIGCDFSLPKFLASRLMEAREMDQLIEAGLLGPLQGFRSRQGFPFAAVIKLDAEKKLVFDFGDDKKDDGTSAEVDFTGKEPVGHCPKCQGNVFENGMNYVCERSVSASKSCDFRTGSIILQQAIDRTQAAKLLSQGKTDLLKEFVSKKTGRKFEAFLTLKDGKVGFEFAPREKKFPDKAKKAAEPEVKVDFTGQTAVGACPKCKGKVYEGPTAWICERTQADTRKCTFKVGKTILSQTVERPQVEKLLRNGRTEALSGFLSKAGKNFTAHLVLGQRGKVEFEFPDR